MKRHLCAAFMLAASLAFAWTNNVQAQSEVFAFDLRFAASNNLFSFDPTVPLVHTQIGPSPLDWVTFALDFNATGSTLFAVNHLGGASNNTIGTVNLTTAAFTPNAIITGDFGATGSPTGLSIDPTTGSAFLSHTTQLFDLDLSSGVSTLIGDFTGLTPGGAAIGLVIDIAIDNFGNMFAHDISNDALWQIDSTNGDATFIGFSGLAANFAQGMDFDPSTNLLYAAIYTGGGTGSWGTWDTTTGVFTEIEPLPNFPDPNGNGRELEVAIRSLVVIPEPGSLALVMVGAATCLFTRRRRTV